MRARDAGGAERQRGKQACLAEIGWKESAREATRSREGLLRGWDGAEGPSLDWG